MFHRVSKREKHLKPRGRRPSGFIVFERLEADETRSTKYEAPTKKIGLNYYLNKFSQLRSARSLKIECKSLNSPRDAVNISVF